MKPKHLWTLGTRCLNPLCNKGAIINPDPGGPLLICKQCNGTGLRFYSELPKRR